MPTILFAGHNLGGHQSVRRLTKALTALARARRNAGTRKAADALLATGALVCAANEVGVAEGSRDGYGFFGGDRCGLWVRVGTKVADTGVFKLSDAFATPDGRDWGHKREAEFVVVDAGLKKLVTGVAAHAAPMRGHGPAIDANAEGQRTLAAFIRRQHAADRYVLVHFDANDGDISDELRGLLHWRRTGKVDWIGCSPDLASAYRMLPASGSDHPGHAIAVSEDGTPAAPARPRRPERRTVRRARRRRARADRPRRSPRVPRRRPAAAKPRPRPRRRPVRRPRPRVRPTRSQ